MKTTTFLSVAFVAASQILGVYAASSTTASAPTQSPSTVPIENQLTSHGCYKSGGNLTVAKGVSFVSSGSCYNHCKEKEYNVMGLYTTNCYCGNVYPPDDDLVSDSKCSYGCPGYDKEACGGLGGYYSIFNTGLQVDVDSMPAESTSSSSSAASSSTSTSASSSTADSVASTTAASTDTSEKKGGTNTAAIAAGSVVGVVALAGIVGAAVFFVRRRRNAEIEEEHRRNAAVNAFINGSKPPGSSGSISMTDSRLDPVMAHRRLSDGSIADNQDYSRRILRVTNA